MRNINGGGIALAENFSMKEISLFRAGGMAELYAEPRTFDELLAVLDLASRRNLHIEVIGAGSHILAPESGIEGLLISTRSMKGITIRGDLLTAGPGMRLLPPLVISKKEMDQGLEIMAKVLG